MPETRISRHFPVARFIAIYRDVVFPCTAKSVTVLLVLFYSGRSMQSQRFSYSVVDPKTCCGKSNVRCRGFYFNSHSREEQGGKGKRRLLPCWWWNSCQETESQPVRTSYILLEKEILPRTNPSLLTPPPILCQWILLGTAADSTCEFDIKFMWCKLLFAAWMWNYKDSTALINCNVLTILIGRLQI